MNEQCPICCADMMHTNPNLCKNFHDQMKAREFRERQLAEIKLHDNTIRKDEREKILKTLRDACVSRSWVDTDDDPHFGALALGEIEDLVGGDKKCP